MMKGKKGYAKGGAAMKKKKGYAKGGAVKTGTSSNTTLRGRVAGSKKKPMQTGKGLAKMMARVKRPRPVGGTAARPTAMGRPRPTNTARPRPRPMRPRGR